MSTTRKSKPETPSASAVAGVPLMSQAPNTVRPSCNARLKRLVYWSIRSPFRWPFTAILRAPAARPGRPAIGGATSVHQQQAGAAHDEQHADGGAERGGIEAIVQLVAHDRADHHGDDRPGDQHEVLR